jgi:predicted RNA-binding Zn-ribbon protein involved in translation (DUF1610 family)
VVVVERFRDVADAELANSALEAAGIQSFLADANVVGVVWTYSNAVGGIRLMVADEDLEAARSILQTDQSGELELSEAERAVSDRCPTCGSLDIVVEKGSRKTAALMLWTILPLWIWRTRARCRNCGNVWKPRRG